MLLYNRLFFKNINFTTQFYMQYLIYTSFGSSFNYDSILPQVFSILPMHLYYLENSYNSLHFYINIRLVYVYIYKIILNLDVSFNKDSSVYLVSIYNKILVQEDSFTLPKEVLPVILYLTDLSNLT